MLCYYATPVAIIMHVCMCRVAVGILQGILRHAMSETQQIQFSNHLHTIIGQMLPDGANGVCKQSHWNSIFTIVKAAVHSMLD